MSLINQVLSDLEARRGGHRTRASEVLEGLRPTAAQNHGFAPWRTVIAVCFVVFAAAGAWYLRGAVDDAPVARAGTASEPAGADLASRRPAGAGDEAGAGARMGAVAPESGARDAVSGRAVDIDPEVGRPTAQDGDAEVRGAAGTEAPTHAGPGAFEAPVEEPAFLAMLEEAARITVPDAAPDPAAGPEHDVHPIAAGEPETPAIEGPGAFQKTMSAPAPDTDRDRRLAEARGLLASGRSRRGTELLRALVADEPDFVAAREQLAQVLMKSGAVGEATEVLEAGLTRTPREWRYAWLLAHILVGRDDDAAALRLLRSAAPAVDDDLEYHAFIAALAQRQGQFGAAAETYRELLARKPTNGVWWIGLGVSLAAAGQQDAAREAYRRAVSDGALSPSLRAYADRQITRLQRPRS